MGETILLFKKLLRLIFVNIPLQVRGMAIGRGTYLPFDIRVRQPCHIAIGEENTINSGFVCRDYSKKNKTKAIKIGSKNVIDSNVTLSVGDQASLTIGDGNWIGAGSFISPKIKISIGNDCQIAAGCALYDFNHGMKLTGRPMSKQPCAVASIELRDDVWLGHGVTVLKGVEIGCGAVVAAGSVVTKSIPDFEIWGGVPARKLSVRK